MFARARALATWLVVALACVRPAAAELAVSAAASLTDALTEVARAWESTGRPPVRLNFGASSTLAQQIEAGAPVDVFVSADIAQMDRVDRAGALLPGTRRTVLLNSLVVVVPAGNDWAPRSAAELADPRLERLALADPAAVPAGVYAREWLLRAGVWERVAPRVVPVENVRAALAAAESGNADAAIVYVTDAAPGRGVRVAFTVPPPESPPVRYPAAVVRQSTDPATARAFVAFLLEPRAREVFARHGFGSPD